MSGGTPVGGGLMRQRHSQGYASSNDDIEDDACSRLSPQSPLLQKTWTRVEIMEIILWIASVVFILYYGDRHSNFFYLLWYDDRIRRIPLYLGMVGVGLNVIFSLYTSMLPWSSSTANEKLDFSSRSALPFAILLGFISFCLFSFALWPIWSFLSPPLVFTLLMSGMVLAPYVMFGTSGPQTMVFRID